MKLVIRFFLILVSASLLSGCLFGMHNRENAYLEANSISPTKVPEAIAPIKLEATYPVPEGEMPSGKTPVSITPPGMPVMDLDKSANKESGKTIGLHNLAMSQMRVNSKIPTLEINSAYAQAWQAVTTQLAPLGYQILGADKQTGVIEVRAIKDSQTNSIYQFSLQKYRESTLVTLLDQQGQVADETISKQMLEHLGAQLNK